MSMKTLEDLIKELTSKISDGVELRCCAASTSRFADGRGYSTPISTVYKKSGIIDDAISTGGNFPHEIVFNDDYSIGRYLITHADTGTIDGTLCLNIPKTREGCL